MKTNGIDNGQIVIPSLTLLSPEVQLVGNDGGHTDLRRRHAVQPSRYRTRRVIQQRDDRVGIEQIALAVHHSDFTGPGLRGEDRPLVENPHPVV